jgi:hypothetical protein
MIGKNIGEQVRIERPTANGTALALYTVEDVHDRESDIVFVGYNNPDGLSSVLSQARLKLRSRLRVLLMSRQRSAVNFLNA